MIHIKVIIFIFTILCFNLSCQLNENTITNEEARLLCDKIELMYNNADIKIAKEILDSAYVLYSPLFPSELRSIEAFTYNIKSNARSFPDFHLSIDSFFVKDDIIYSYWTQTGTNTGPLGRMPTTGKSIEISGFAISRVRDGKIYEEHKYWNVLEFYEQLGFKIFPPESKDEG